MLLTKATQLPQGEGWGFEAKLDGYRMVAEFSPEKTLLLTRHGNNFTDRYPDVVQQLPAVLPDCSAVFDGEMVGIGKDGHHSFQELRRKHPRVIYYIFDLLELDREPLIREPLAERRRLLEENLVPQDSVKVSEQFFDRDELVDAAIEFDLEGIVAKRLTSVYRPGVRSKDWLKWKPSNRHTEGWNRS